MKNKKVCVLTSLHKHDDVRIYHKEAVSLAKAGFDVTILCTDCQTVDEHGVKFRIVEPKGRSRVLRMLTSSFRFFGRALDENAAVYHFHDPELILAGFLLKVFGKKVVYDVHEDVPRQIMSKPWIKRERRAFLSKSFERFENLFAKCFDLIVAATPVIGDRFPAEKTVVIYNYPKLEEFPNTVPDFEDRENIACYMGAVTKIRGIFEVVQSALYTDCKVVIAGQYESEELQRQVEELSGYGRTDYVGFLNRKEVAELLARSKVGLVTLHPTVNYMVSLPIKMFEYMACGLPVIASDFPYWREILEDPAFGRSGVCVDPLDPKAIGDAVNYIVAHKQEAEQMGRNGREAIMKKYNWGMEEEKLVKAYHGLFEHHKHAALKADNRETV